MLVALFRKVLLAMSLMAISATSAMAQPAMPDTPVGRLAALYFDANNSLDPAQLTDFLKTHLPHGLSNPQYPETQQTLGGFDVLSVDKITDSRLTLTVRARKTELQYRMLFVLDSENADRLRMIVLGFF